MLGYRFCQVHLGLIACTVAFQPSLMAAIPESGTLMLSIDGLRSQDGVVCVALFDDQAGFPTDGAQAIRNSCFAVTEVPLVVSFSDLRYGEYAVSLLHDEDQNGRLNTGIFGIPLEGVGFSNNPRLSQGAPSFDATRFNFTQSSGNVQVNMRYF
jgi:uncharacterized protein (DUF2141 family)